MHQRYDNKAMQPETKSGVWVTIIDGAKSPYCYWITATQHETIEHYCHEKTRRSGVLTCKDGQWRYEVTG